MINKKHYNERNIAIKKITTKERFDFLILWRKKNLETFLNT